MSAGPFDRRAIIPATEIPGLDVAADWKTKSGERIHPVWGWAVLVLAIRRTSLRDLTRTVRECAAAYATSRQQE